MSDLTKHIIRFTLLFFGGLACVIKVRYTMECSTPDINDFATFGAGVTGMALGLFEIPAIRTIIKHKSK